jgi:magnesium-transporting ATPase (P-type)
VVKPGIRNFIHNQDLAVLWSAVYIFFFIKSIFSFPVLTPLPLLMSALGSTMPPESVLSCFLSSCRKEPRYEGEEQNETQADPNEFPYPGHFGFQLFLVASANIAVFTVAFRDSGVIKFDGLIVRG